MPQLDETALRRPDFKPGVEIVLTDGQTWTFPSPSINSYYFVTGRDGQPRLAAGSSFGTRFDELVDDFVDAETVSKEALALYRLAMAMLTQNYSLADADSRHILRRALPGSPEADRSGAMWQAIADAALGVGSKKTDGPMPGGSSSASEPTASPTTSLSPTP